MDNMQTIADFINGVLDECGKLTRVEYSMIPDQDEYLELEREAQDRLRDALHNLTYAERLCKALAKINADVKGMK